MRNKTKRKKEAGKRLKRKRGPVKMLFLFDMDESGKMEKSVLKTAYPEMFARFSHTFIQCIWVICFVCTINVRDMTISL